MKSTDVTSDAAVERRKRCALAIWVSSSNVDGL